MPSIDLQSPYLPQPKQKGSEQIIAIDDYINSPTSLIPFADLLDFSEFARHSWSNTTKTYVDDLNLDPTSPSYVTDINWLDSWTTTEGHFASAAQKVRFTGVKDFYGAPVTIAGGGNDGDDAYNISSSGELRFKSRAGDNLTVKSSFFLENNIDNSGDTSSSHDFKRSIQVNAKYVGDTTTALDNVDYRFFANTNGWSMNDQSESWESTSLSMSIKSSLVSASIVGKFEQGYGTWGDNTKLQFSSYNYRELDQASPFNISFRGNLEFGSYTNDTGDYVGTVSTSLNKISVTTADYRLTTNVLNLKNVSSDDYIELLPIDNWNQVSTTYHDGLFNLIRLGNNVVIITNPEGVSIDVGDGNDRVTGGTGDDIIRGGRGKDVLTGGVTATPAGANADIFVFGSEIMEADLANGKMNAWNRDTITDFATGTDKIAFVYDELFGYQTMYDDEYPMPPVEITAAMFTSNATGKNAFVGTGSNAVMSNFNFIYNTADKTLYYDADGSGEGLEIAVVSLTGTSNAPVLADLIFI
jgi:Ca2+-binding RTX toxin-like protein